MDKGSDDRVLVAAGALAVAAVVFGFWGYRRLLVGEPLLDIAYAAVQLLVLSPQSGPPGSTTPWQLHIGRWAGVAAVGLSVGLVLARLGRSRVAHLRARWARRHRVVIGNSSVARALAHGQAASTEARSLLHPVVLVSDGFPIEGAGKGVAVVPLGSDARLRRVLRGAERVVIAVDDDSDAMTMFGRVERLLSPPAAPDRTEPAIHLVLKSSEVARVILAERAMGTNGANEVSAAAVPEIVASWITDPTHFPPVVGHRTEHIVVIGRGRFAEAMLVASTVPWERPGVRSAVDVFTDDLTGWPELVSNLASEWRIVDLCTGSLAPASVVGKMVESCGDADRTVVYLAGLPDADGVALGHHLAANVPHGRVVTLVDRTPFRDLVPTVIASGTTWHAVSVEEILSDPKAVGGGVGALLGSALLAHIELWRVLDPSPSTEALIERLLGAEPGGRAQGARTLARSILAALDAAGVHCVPRLTAASPAELGLDVIQSLVAALADRCGAAGADLALRARLTALVARLPRILAAARLELHPSVPPSIQLGPAALDCLARSIHDRYVAAQTELGHPTSSTAAKLPWEELEAARQESNRDQARWLAAALSAVGYRLVLAGDPSATPLVLTADQIEVLASLEHERWCEHTLATGNGDHPSLVPYAELAEAVKELDRLPVRSYADHLAGCGLAVAQW